MSKTVVGVFQDYPQAERVAQALEAQGYSSSDISVVANDHKGEYTNAEGQTVGHTASGAGTGAGTGAAIGGAAGLALGLVALAIPGIGPIIAMGPLATALTGAGIGAAAGGLIGAMTSMGVPEEDAHDYAGRVKEGEALVMVKTPDNRVNTAVALLEQYGADNVEEDNADTSGGRDTSTTGRSMASAPASTRDTAAGTTTGAIPIVQEEMQVGKRQVQRGGIRVYSHMVEQPVEEQVTLHEEHAKVERRPVNRAATEADLQNFREGTIEVRETAEEAVMGKRARVVEEVVVGKEASERTETVRGTVRHTEVQTEQLGNQTGYQNTGSTSGGYDTSSAGYLYGSELANNPQYRGKKWSEVESYARSDWERRGQGGWESFKDSIRHGWDKVTGNS